MVVGFVYCSYYVLHVVPGVFLHDTEHKVGKEMWDSIYAIKHLTAKQQ